MAVKNENENNGTDELWVENEIWVKNEISFGWWIFRWWHRWASSSDYDGDDLDVGADELLVTTPTSFSLVSGSSLSLSSFRLISLSLSLSPHFSIYKMLFESKITMEMILRVWGGILRSKCKTFSVWPYFQLVTIAHNSEKCFPELVFMWNKCNLSWVLMLKH